MCNLVHFNYQNCQYYHLDLSSFLICGLKLGVSKNISTKLVVESRLELVDNHALVVCVWLIWKTNFVGCSTFCLDLNKVLLLL